MNVNFWNEVITVYINDVKIASTRSLNLLRGTPEFTVRNFDSPLNDEARRVLEHFCGLDFYTPLFGKKEAVYPDPLLSCKFDFDTWNRISDRRGNVKVEHITSVRVEFDYSLPGSEPSFEKLMKYPSDLVVDYLKERGLNVCPFSN